MGRALSNGMTASRTRMPEEEEHQVGVRVRDEWWLSETLGNADGSGGSAGGGAAGLAGSGLVGLGAKTAERSAARRSVS